LRERESASERAGMSREKGQKERKKQTSC